jgi:hypothetical protein
MIKFFCTYDELATELYGKNIKPEYNSVFYKFINPLYILKKDNHIHKCTHINFDDEYQSKCWLYQILDVGSTVVASFSINEEDSDFIFIHPDREFIVSKKSYMELLD